jgi:hypothetical protein
LKGRKARGPQTGTTARGPHGIKRDCNPIAITSAPANPEKLASVYDGRNHVGFIQQDGAAYLAFDHAGTLVGRFSSQSEAIGAIAQLPNKIERAGA